MARRKTGLIASFDVDGTLTAPRKVATPEMLDFMQKLREVVTVGVVGGLDLVKISELFGKTVTDDYDYVFSENGLVAHKDGKLIGSQSLKSFLGEEKLKEFINFTLNYIADLDIPIKRGTFLEFRIGMLHVSPIGRNCSQEERDELEKYDKGGNDYEIYESDQTVGHTVTSPEYTFLFAVTSPEDTFLFGVTSPEDTVEQCTALKKGRTQCTRLPR